MRHFIRHYVEMVIAMFVGMAVLCMPAELRAERGRARAGTSCSNAR